MTNYLALWTALAASPDLPEGVGIFIDYNPGWPFVKVSNKPPSDCYRFNVCKADIRDDDRPGANVDHRSALMLIVDALRAEGWHYSLTTRTMTDEDGETGTAIVCTLGKDGTNHQGIDWGEVAAMFGAIIGACGGTMPTEAG